MRMRISALGLFVYLNLPALAVPILHSADNTILPDTRLDRLDPLDNVAHEPSTLRLRSSIDQTGGAQSDVARRRGCRAKTGSKLQMQSGIPNAGKTDSTGKSNRQKIDDEEGETHASAAAASTAVKEVTHPPLPTKSWMMDYVPTMVAMS